MYPEQENDEYKKSQPGLFDVHENQLLFSGILLSFQHVFAMFGATILVPLILGMPVSVALFASGIGTLIYQAKLLI